MVVGGTATRPGHTALSDADQDRQGCDGRWLAIGLAVLVALSAYAAVFLHEV